MSSTTSDEITADFAKMEMELKLSNSRNRELELENKLVQAELREQKVMGMQNELMAKIAKMEKEMKQQQKEEKKGEEPKENESCDKNGQLEQQKQLDDLEPKKKTNDSWEEKKKRYYKQWENALQNWWDAEVCHGDLQISGGQHLDVYYKRNGCRSVFATHPISHNNSGGIFYFEIKVEKMLTYMTFGLASNEMPLEGGVGLNKQKTYTYSSGGHIRMSDGPAIYREIPSFSAGDVVGCGVNLTNRRIFFTKNGQRLAKDNDSVISSPTDSLFPFVSLFDADDKIVANFGTRFNFNIGTV